MSHPYNLRRQKLSPVYKERDNEEEDESEEYEDELGLEEVGSQKGRQNRKSHRSTLDDSHLNFSGHNSSGLSSTASDSFSYHSGSSPSSRTDSRGLYPDLSTAGSTRTGSPETRRRPIHERGRSPDETTENSHRDPNISPPHSSRHPKKKDTEQSMFEFLFEFLKKKQISLLAVIAIVLLLIGLALNKESTQASESVSQNEFSDFDKFCKQVDSLKEQFPNQSVRFWKVVKSCTKHVFDPEQATYPAVLLIVGEKKHAVFTSRIAEAVRQEFESIRLKSSSQDKEMSLNLTSSAGSQDIDGQKLFLDNWLKERLDNNHVAVVVNHLESLLPEAALLLHGYCDGDNAPYKEAMLIFGLFLDHPVDSARAAEEALGNLWRTEFMMDKVGALLSRVANNIVLVTSPSK